MIPGSDEWRQARCGSIGASDVPDVVARTKSGWSASRENKLAEKALERITGKPADSFVSAAMQYGTDTEAEARSAYELMCDVDVLQIAIVRHPRIIGAHASPDGLVGPEGLVQIKCPNPSTHMTTLLDGKINGRYVTQVHWEMACTERAWCDFVSYDRRFPGSMSLWIKRIERDDKMISELEEQVQEFLHELDAKVKALREKYEAKELAA